MDYLPLPDQAARQLIDATTIFEAWRSSQKQARSYAGGMYWKRQGAYEYLVKTGHNNRQTRLGARNPETEATYAHFTQNKLEFETRTQSLRQALNETERLNRALKVGRAPAMLITLLQTLEDAGLEEHFIVVGTHALYAYETAAAVRIVQGALATQDIDLLWDARRRMKFLTTMEKLDTSILKILQRADPSFQRKEGQNETAINNQGFEIDFIRRQPEGDDPHPMRFSDDEEDLWPVQAVRASVLTSAPKFKHIVVSAQGRMAHMNTLDPHTFVDFKRWMASQAPHRPDMKRRRDARQADIVQALLNAGALI